MNMVIDADDKHLTALVQTMLTPQDKIRLRRHAQQRHHTPSALVRAVVLDWMTTQERDHGQS